MLLVADSAIPISPLYAAQQPCHHAFSEVSLITIVVWRVFCTALRHGSKYFAGAIASTVYKTSLQTHAQGFNHATYQLRRDICNAHLHQDVLCTGHWGASFSEFSGRFSKRCMHSGQYSVCTKVLQKPLEPDVSQNGVEHHDANHRRDAIYLQHTSDCDDTLLATGALRMHLMQNHGKECSL